jgi:hypothetical protein
MIPHSGRMMPPIPLFVGADPSLATLGLDVDDDLALLFLLCSPEVERFRALFLSRVSAPRAAAG